MTNNESTAARLLVLEAEMITAQAAVNDAFVIAATETGLNRSAAANHVMKIMKAETTNEIAIDSIELAAIAYLNS